MRVWVSHVENPTEFYIQFKDDEDGLQAMSRQLNEALRDSSQAEIRKSEIKEEMMVAAVFSNDDLWYRAEVSGCYVNTSPAYVSVVYVDYGNSENVSIRNITKLPPGMESGPFYGHKCLLAGIQPPSLFSNVAPPSWSQKAITHFKNAVDPDKDEEEINVVMKEVCRNSDGYREVDLFTVSPDGSLRSVAHRLVQIGLAARSGGLRFRFRLVLYFALSSRCTGCYSGIWGEPCNDAGYEIIPSTRPTQRNENVTSGPHGRGCSSIRLKQTARRNLGFRNG
jgi:hypothetical protein